MILHFGREWDRGEQWGKEKEEWGKEKEKPREEGWCQ